VTPIRRRTLGALAALLLAGTIISPGFAQDAPVQGGTLIYLEQQAHTNLYPPGRRLLSERRRAQPDHRQADLPEPGDARERAVARRVVAGQRGPPPSTPSSCARAITFSDGTPLDAEAVAVNYDTFGLGNKELKYPVSEVINNYDHAEVVDDLTIRFHFKHPSPGFLQGTAVIGSGIVSPATLALPYDELGDATKIIGSGPFVVASETLGKELNLTVRADYNWGPAKFEHQGRAYLDGIKYLITPEDSVRIGAPALRPGRTSSARSRPMTSRRWNDAGYRRSIRRPTRAA
jgi:peptide/nickel transport system substrate-binding protein